MVLTGKKGKYLGKTNACSYLFTVKSSETGLGSKPGFHYKRPATNLFSHAVYPERQAKSSTTFQ